MTCPGCGAALPAGAHGNQKWCSDHCRKRTFDQTTYVGSCRCGASIRRDGTLCRDCYDGEQDRQRLARWLAIATLWAEGVPMKDMVKDSRVQRSTKSSLGVEMDRMKKAGFRLPPRRKGWKGHTNPGGPPPVAAVTRNQARMRVGHAVRTGALVRPDTCDSCGVDARVQAHHADYSKPLEVEWLCRTCHSVEHGKLVAA